MSRRKPDAMHLQVVLDVMCPRGHRVGIVVKMLDPHPRAGTYQVGLPLRFEDVTTPGDQTGRVRGVCHCGADVQVSWRRAKEEIDEHEARGKHTGHITG